MCERCDPFYKTVPVGAGAAWREQVDRLQVAVAAGVLEDTGGSPPWPAVAAAADRPGSPAAGCVRLTFACATCAQVFLLERGGCGPFGDQWRALSGN